MGTGAQDRTQRNPQQSVVDQIARAIAQRIVVQLETLLTVNDLTVLGNAQIDGTLVVGDALTANSPLNAIVGIVLGNADADILPSAGTLNVNTNLLALCNKAGNRTYVSYDNGNDLLTFGRNTRLNSTPPASSSGAGTAKQIAVDGNFIYVCTATNTWKRVALVAY